MRRLERGASYVPLIIVVVLLMVAVIWAWMKTDESDQLAKKLKTAEEAKAESETNRAAAVNYLTDDVAALTGYHYPKSDTENFPNRRVSATKMKADLGKMFKSCKDKYQLKVPLAAFYKNIKEDGKGGELYRFKETYLEEAEGEDPFHFRTDDGRIYRIREQEKDFLVFYLPGAIPPEADQTAEELVRVMDKAARRMVSDLNALVALLESDREVTVKAIAGYKATEQELKDLIRAQQSELTALEETKQSEIRSKEGEIETLRTDVTKWKAMYDKEKKARVEAIAEVEEKLDMKAQEVVKLKRRTLEKSQPIGPDGKVLAAASGGGLVVIDRGKKHRMVPGLRFNVYTYGKGARRIDKGVIKVTEVDDRTSTAEVKDLLNPMRPIVQGDLFESLAYNPEEVMHFRLIGVFRKYGRSDAERRLTDIGMIVDKAVTIDTDFLVLGAPEGESDNLRESDDYKRAVELGIKVITEEHLTQFLMY